MRILRILNCKGTQKFRYTQENGKKRPEGRFLTFPVYVAYELGIGLTYAQL